MNKVQNSQKQQTSSNKGMLKRLLRKRISTGSPENVVSFLAKRGVLGRAARLAVEKQFAKGVPAIWMEQGIIYKVYPNGQKEKLASKEHPVTKFSQRRFYIQK